MKRYDILILLTLIMASCTNAQRSELPRVVGGPCEGCEAILEYDEDQLSDTDTLPDFNKEGTRLKISGTVYESDGKTPAPGVILYVYHTDQQGLYSPRPDSEGWERTHGYNRGWLQTDANGQYTFYTLKPAPYPNRTDAAHIHITVLEPSGKYYWLDGYTFAGDPLLNPEDTSRKDHRGGSSGILNLEKEGDLWTGTRDIILGKHVAGYD